MLGGSDYSPWVKVVFACIETNTKLKSFKMLATLPTYIVEQVLFKSKVVRARQLEHWNYSKECVDRRLARTPDRRDLWTKILENEAPNDKEGPTLGEHHSLASAFMVAGTETTATVLSGTTYHSLTNPDKLNLLKEEIRSSFDSLDDLHLEPLATQKHPMAVLQEGLRMYPPVPPASPRKVPAGGATVCGGWLSEGTLLGVHHSAGDI